MTPARRLPRAVALLIALAACDRQQRPTTREQLVAGGDPELAKARFERYGCGSCHDIPGIPGAQGRVGPPLARWAARSLVAGTLPNTPESLIRWIQDPPSVDPKTAMPNVGVTETDARHMAAYLYTLR